VWFVGDNGKISLYDGENWQNQQSGCTIKLRDVYGHKDQNNNNQIIYSCGFNFGYLEGVILRKENNNAWEVFDSGSNGIISSLDSGNNFASVWMANINTFFVTAFKDVYKLKQIGPGRYHQRKILNGYKGIYRIRGNAVNDFFVAGDNTDLRHYNGKSWSLYSDLSVYGTVYSLDFNDDIVVAVSSGTIFIGRRNQ